MSIQKVKKNGKFYYRIKDKEGKYVMALGTEEDIIEAVKFYKEVGKNNLIDFENS